MDGGIEAFPLSIVICAPMVLGMCRSVPLPFFVYNKYVMFKLYGTGIYPTAEKLVKEVEKVMIIFVVEILIL